jgi:TonB family protein
MRETPVPPPSFSTLEPEEKQGRFDLVQGLAGVLIGVFGLSVLLFGVFVVARAVAPPVLQPIVWKTAAPGVKPDSVYAGSPVSVSQSPQNALGKGDDIVYFAPTTADLPELVSSEEASYPKGKAANGCESTVMMRITIDANGVPKDPSVRQESPCGLDYPALKAVMNWRFRPARMDGRPLPVGAWVQVHFR